MPANPISIYPCVRQMVDNCSDYLSCLFICMYSFQVILGVSMRLRCIQGSLLLDHVVVTSRFTWEKLTRLLDEYVHLKRFCESSPLKGSMVYNNMIVLNIECTYNLFLGRLYQVLSFGLRHLEILDGIVKVVLFVRVSWYDIWHVVTGIGAKISTGNISSPSEISMASGQLVNNMLKLMNFRGFSVQRC